MQYILSNLIDEADWQNLTRVEQRQVMSAFVEYAAGMKASGALVGAFRPQPSGAARTVRVADGETRVREGRHGATREQLSGLYIIDAADLDAAISWAARNPVMDFGAVEVRPLLSPTS